MWSCGPQKCRKIHERRYCRVGNKQQPRLQVLDISGNFSLLLLPCSIVRMKPGEWKLWWVEYHWTHLLCNVRVHTSLRTVHKHSRVELWQFQLTSPEFTRGRHWKSCCYDLCTAILSFIAQITAVIISKRRYKRHPTSSACFSCFNNWHNCCHHRVA